MSNDASAGQTVVISGPSGAGKSTLVRQLIDACPLPLVLSISATTRSPRDKEQDGIDYHFLTREEFDRRRKADDFLEYKEVFKSGDWYGTLRSAVSSGLDRGKWVILEIDVEGMASVVEKIPDAITIFIHPGSLDELETRLRNRRTESEEQIQRRLEVARREMAVMDRYDHQVINATDASDQAVQAICQILMQAE